MTLWHMQPITLMRKDRHASYSRSFRASQRVKLQQVRRLHAIIHTVV